MTTTPNRSKRLPTAALAPEAAKTAVPTSSAIRLSKSGSISREFGSTRAL